MNYLSKNLKFLRKQNSINQSVLATKMKKGQSSIGNWENGISEPNITELQFLAHFFGISISDLLERDLGIAELQENSTDKNFNLKASPAENTTVNEIEDEKYIKGSTDQLILEQLINLTSEVKRLSNNIDSRGNKASK